MTNPSPLPHSYSPPRSAFHWPAPLSPRLKQQDNDNTTATNTDLFLKDILETYKNDDDILRYILIAKAEEDKRQAARDMLKTEQARIQLKQLDLEYLREQSRMARYYDKSYQQSHISEGHTADRPAITGTTLPPPSSLASSYVSGLAPVQQQVLARITGNHSDTHHLLTYGSHHDQPSSPVAYPHSAHPLCPPTDLRIKNTPSTTRYNASTSTPAGSASQHYRHRLQPPSINTSTSSNPAQPSTPISPAIGNNNNNDDIPSSGNPTTTRYKRTRHSVSDQLDDKLSHNKVMEALKAKIQRGNGSPISTTPTSALPYRPSFADTFHMDKRQRQLPKPIVTSNNGSSSAAATAAATAVTEAPGNVATIPTTAVHTPSPRSAKPLLPPIDTSVGRHQKHRSSSPVHIPPASANTINANTTNTPPSISRASPSDHFLAMTPDQLSAVPLHLQERHASHSPTTTTAAPESKDTPTRSMTATKIKLEID